MGNQFVRLFHKRLQNSHASLYSHESLALNENNKWSFAIIDVSSFSDLNEVQLHLKLYNFF